MAKQTIGIGTIPNDGTGDPLRTAMDKVNDNFTEVYNSLASIGTTYYVKTGGSDSAAGTSDGTAWAHHPWMSTWTGSVTLVPGDIVSMNKGDTWSISSPSDAYITVAQSGTVGSPITINAYGTGAKPIIKIATNSNQPVIFAEGKSYITFDNIDVQHFSKERAVTGQHGFLVLKDVSVNVPHDWVITNCTVHNIPQTGIVFWGDCYNITIGDIAATTTATAVSYSNHVYDCGYAGIVLEGCNPADDRSDFNIYYNYVHDIDYAGPSDRDEYGIAITCSPEGTGQWQSHAWPKYVYVRYNRITDIPRWDGIDSHGGSYMYFTDNYIYDCRKGIVVFANYDVDYPTAICDYVYIERNEIVRSGAGLVYTKGMQISADDPSYRATNIYVAHNNIYWEVREAETGAYGMEIFMVDGLTIEYNNFYSGPTGLTNGAIQIQSSGGQPCKNIIIRNNSFIDWDDSIDIYTEDIDGDIAIYNNVMHSSGNCIELESGTSDSGTITIYNNTMMSDINGNSRYPIRCYTGFTLGTGCALIIKNNILSYSTNSVSMLFIQGPDTVTGTLTIDYNLYWNSSDATPYKVSGSEHSWTDWKAHGYDAHSLTGECPFFSNFSGTYSLAEDFILCKTSPAIDIGVDVGITTDYSGQDRVGITDIGAWEKFYITYKDL